MNKHGNLGLLVRIFSLLVILSLVACVPASPAPVAEEPSAPSEEAVVEEPAAEEPVAEEAVAEEAYAIPAVHIVLGNYPVFDLAPWVAAENWGYLEELNITLEHKVFPDERSGMQALASGSSQLQLMGEMSLIGVAPTFSEFRAVFVPNVFQGFAPLVRDDGKIKTYVQMKEEISDPAEALRATCAQVEGKTWIAQMGASHETTVDATLECGGLTRDDLNFIDIGPAEGATAFLRGEGDIYLGDVPNRYRLEEEGMVPLVTAGDLGQKAFSYPTVVADTKWLSKPENEDALLRLIGVWYRAVAELNAGGPRAEEAFQGIADWVNKGAGTSFTPEASEYIYYNVYVPQPTFEETIETFYTADGTFEWANRLQWGVEIREGQGEIKPGEVDPASITLSEELFKKLLAYKEAAEAGIAAGGPNAELAQKFYDQMNYVDAAKVLE